MFLRVEEIVYPTNNVYLAKILKLIFVKHIQNIIGIYILLCCKDSIACWRQQNLWSQLEQQMLLADGFKEIFTNILQCFNEDQVITFAMTTWSLWRKRNMQL
jgi:hypothetical protein